jgi:hypothetical protein
MKAVIRNVSRTLIFAGGITLAATAANAQMKIGDNPSVIEKSAILELNSTKQGLLLPRLTNFTAINTVIGANVVDGMIVYLASGTPANDGVYMRKAGAWVKISSAADAITNWSLTGNAATTAANYVGTSDAMPLSIRANAIEGISVQTDGQLQFKNVTASTTLMDVVVINTTNGNVSRRALPVSAFNSLFSNLATNASVTNTAFSLTENTTTGAVTFNAPILDAANAVGTNYGFLSKADWDKLQALTTGTNFTIADFVTVVAAGKENNGGVITYNAATANYNLQLVAASATYAGIVTTGVQTFGGDKTFNAKVNVGTDLAVAGKADVVGAATVGGTLGATGATTLGNTLAVTGATTLSSTLAVTGAATLSNNLAVTTGTTNLGGAVTLGTVVPTATAASYDVLVKNTTTNVVEKKAFNLDALTTAVQFITTGATSTSGASVGFLPGTTGTDFNVVADGTAKTVTFNLPDASAVDATHTAVQRGAVSSADQTFAGNKSFASSVAVGATTVANSTLQVAGSVSMAIKNVTGAYTITAADNTILANATAAGFTVTLPDAVPAIAGRIYTIKKIGTGDINNPIVVIPASGGAIEGSAAGVGYTIYNDWTYITVQTDGAAWYIIKK